MLILVFRLLVPSSRPVFTHESNRRRSGSHPMLLIATQHCRPFCTDEILGRIVNPNVPFAAFPPPALTGCRSSSSGRSEVDGMTPSAQHTNMFCSCLPERLITAFSTYPSSQLYFLSFTLINQTENESRWVKPVMAMCSIPFACSRVDNPTGVKLPPVGEDCAVFFGATPPAAFLWGFCGWGQPALLVLAERKELELTFQAGQVEKSQARPFLDILASGNWPKKAKLERGAHINTALLQPSGFPSIY